MSEGGTARRIAGRVLIVAGSASGGGAGIQADIKSVTALGGYAMTAITALTAQNTEGVFGVHEVPTAFLRQQMRNGFVLATRCFAFQRKREPRVAPIGL